MSFLLAALLLCGLSFVGWGLAGACRLVHERERRSLEGITYLLAVAGLGTIVATGLVLASHLPPGMSAWYDSPELSPPTTREVWLSRLWLVSLSGLGLYATLRFFEVRRVLLAGLIVAPLFCGALQAVADTASAGALVLLTNSGSPELIAVSATVLAVAWAWRVQRGWRGVGLLEPTPQVSPEQVAALICARDEEAVIGVCLDRVLAILPPANIFVASDGSTDRTAAIAREAGCHVLEIEPNGGKARALAALIDHFEIADRFEAALILDADAEIDARYLERALPLLDDPEVVAIAGHANPKWFSHWWPRWKMFFAAYRVRLYALTQALLRYGQTWKLANVSFIIPGFASVYRTRVLGDIDIAAPGLSVEDFNMTFEIHRKRLGKIAYSPSACCTSQEAHGLIDYVKQVRRWYLGFWQTVRRHGIWPSFFWLSLGAFVVEMLLASVILLAVPLVLLWLALADGAAVTLWLPPLGTVDITLFDVMIAILLADYALTGLVAAVERKPVLLIYGLGFSALRLVDAALFVYTLPLAFFEASDGRWASPRRLLGPPP